MDQPLLKNTIFWHFEKWNILHNFQLFSPKIEKIEFFYQNDGLTPIDWDSGLLAIVQKDIFFYVEQHLTFNVSNSFCGTTPLLKTAIY